jgi:hypothetical protein
MDPFPTDLLFQLFQWEQLDLSFLLDPMFLLDLLYQLRRLDRSFLLDQMCLLFQ